ncbi:hypothetical protein WJX77_003366 [Trebouxia sp. C0004]
MGGDPSVKLVLDCHTDLGESPVWDARTGRLYFVDINEKHIHVYTPQDKNHFVIDAPSTVGCVVPTSDPNILLAALGSNVVEVNVSEKKTGRIVAFVSTDDNAEGTRFNDGKATPQGVFIVGRMNRAWRDGQPGKLFAMDLRVPGNSFGLMTILGPTEVCCPNGMDWDQDKNVFYFIDTADAVVRSYPVDENGVPKRSQDGVLLGVKDVITLSEEGIVLDGMTIDSKGNLWIAHGEGGAIVCYNPSTGKEIQRVELPVRRPTSCTFGGPDLKTLYITTRHEGRHLDEGKKASENWGGLFSVEIPGVTGARPALYVQMSQK